MNTEQLVLVGIAEIARLAGVEKNTVYVWYRRGLMPEPLAQLSCGRIWSKHDIDAWLAGRVKNGRRAR
jgi:predicted DNA-binding transcriptional regulator AlpA